MLHKINKLTYQHKKLLIKKWNIMLNEYKDHVGALAKIQKLSKKIRIIEMQLAAISKKMKIEI